MRMDTASTSAVVIPGLGEDRLYVGIDVGKSSHVAGIVSPRLLTRHKRFERCPTLSFAQSAQGFAFLLDWLDTHAYRANMVVLLESTGHYHRNLERFLADADIAVYVMHVQKRMSRMTKSDTRDALGLANHLYNQIALRVQNADKTQVVHPSRHESEATLYLKSLVRRRYELVRDITRTKNRLTALCDELFPEFTQMFADPNGKTALRIRRMFAEPTAIASATLFDLRVLKEHGKPNDTLLLRLKETAASSVGTQDVGRRQGLVFEQTQLLEQMEMQTRQREALDTEIIRLVGECREGKILCSIPGISEIQASVLLAAIGSIAYFESSAALKAFLGWAPKLTQTGTSTNHMALAPSGLRMSKQTLYLIALNVIREETAFQVVYHRLVPLKCTYDERTKTYKGKLKVVGRICGQVIGLIYRLLKDDAMRVATTPKGSDIPSPALYDAAKHLAAVQRACISPPLLLPSPESKQAESADRT